jgi:hypothetical protein
MMQVPSSASDVLNLVNSMTSSAKQQAGKKLEQLTAGVITSLPMSVADAQQMLAVVTDIAKDKIGRVLSDVTGGLVTSVPVSMADGKHLLKAMMGKLLLQLSNVLGQAGIDFEYSPTGFMLKYKRGSADGLSPSVQAIVDAMDPSSSALNQIKLPISGAAQMLKRVQLDELQLTLEAKRVIHASVSVKLKGKDATQQIGGRVSMSGVSIDVEVDRPAGSAMNFSAAVVGAWLIGNERLEARLSTDGKTTDLVASTSTTTGLSLDAAVKALGAKFTLPSILSSLRVYNVELNLQGSTMVSSVHGACRPCHASTCAASAGACAHACMLEHGWFESSLSTCSALVLVAEAGRR